MQRQDRMLEIDRRENMLGGDGDGDRAQASVGDDAFSKEMTQNGLKHLKEGKEEIRLTHRYRPVLSCTHLLGHTPLAAARLSGRRPTAGAALCSPARALPTPTFTHMHGVAGPHSCR